MAGIDKAKPSNNAFPDLFGKFPSPLKIFGSVSAEYAPAFTIEIKDVSGDFEAREFYQKRKRLSIRLIDPNATQEKNNNRYFRVARANDDSTRCVADVRLVRTMWSGRFDGDTE